MVAVPYKITNAFMYPLEVRHQRPFPQDAVLSKMDHELERMVKQFVLTRKDIQTFFQPKIDKLFDLRITSLNWLLKNQIALTHLETDWESTLIDFKTNDSFSFLYQTILAAIQANIEGINHLIPVQEVRNQNRRNAYRPLPKLPLKTHLNLMQFMVEPFAFDMDLYEQWLIASLQIEFGVLVAVCLHDKKIPIKTVKINELSFFLIGATQQFKAISQQLKGIAVPNPSFLNDETSFFLSSFLENSHAGKLDESPFDRDQMIQKYRIDWNDLPQLQALFKDAPFDDMEQSLTP
jgi:hypothetical protein